MHTVPEWLQTAFAEWITGRRYVDGSGNYRSRVPARPRRVARYNRALRHAYPDFGDFRRAAERWLELRELVPTAI
jgi:hypothetical protein